MYDPVTDVWTSIPNMTRARNGAGAAVIGDNLYAIGFLILKLTCFTFGLSFVSSVILYFHSSNNFLSDALWFHLIRHISTYYRGGGGMYHKTDDVSVAVKLVT